MPSAPEQFVQDRALNHVKGEILRSKNFLNGPFEKMVEWYELYRGIQHDKNYRGRANLFIPEAYANVENIYSRVIKSFRGVRTKPQEKTDLEKATTAKHLLDYQTRVYNYGQGFKDMTKDALIYGSGYLKVVWVFDPDRKRDHPMIISIDPFDYFFDPDALTPDHARWEAHRTYKSYGDLVDDRNKPYISEGLEKLEQRQEAAGGSKDDSFKERRQSAIFSKTGNISNQEGKFEIVEYWGRFKAEGDDEEKDWLFTVADNDVVIRFEENPYKDILPGTGRPFIQMKGIDMPHEYMGMGVVEPIERLQKELNDTRNQRMDNVTQVINPMWQVLRGANIKAHELVSRPNGIIHTSIPNGVMPLAPADVSQSSYNEEQIIKQDIQKAVGVPEVSTGSLGGAQNEAAATVLALMESANIRFDVYIGEFAKAVNETYSKILALNQEFMDKKMAVDIQGEEGTLEFFDVTKDKIKGKIDVDVEMETQLNRIVQRQEAFTLYQMLGANPLVNQMENLRILMDTLGRKDFDKLTDVPPPAPQEPEEPKKSISVSLKGDLNALESDDLAVIMGASKESADPIVREELRELMQGDTGGVKEQERLIEERKMQEKLIEENRLAKKEQADAILNAKKLQIEEKKLAREGVTRDKSDDNLLSNIRRIFSKEGVEPDESEE